MAKEPWKVTKHHFKHVEQRLEWETPVATPEAEYVQRAKDVLNTRPGGDVEGFTRSRTNPQGYIFRKALNEYATARPDGTSETYSRPDEGYQYWIEDIQTWR